MKVNKDDTWQVRVWWIDEGTGSRWEAACQVSGEYANNAYEALQRTLAWRKVTADLDGFNVDLYRAIRFGSKL